MSDFLNDDGRAQRIEPVFNYPALNGTPDDTHEDTVTELLARAVPGSEVRSSIFTLTRMNVAKAFVDAANRGVDVGVLIDESSAEAEATRYLRDQLPDAVAITAGGAIGDNNNHNKFLLLEELENGDRNVVWQSSANFTNTQRHLHNTAVIIRGDVGLYEAYRRYWTDMNAGKRDLNYNRTEECDTATVYFSPRSDFDTHLKALENVTCTENGIVRFLYPIWTEFRSEIVDRLEELVEEGCTVEAIIDEDASTVGPLLERAGVDVLEYPRYTHGEGSNPDQITNVHSKTMLIESDFTVGDETERRRLVYTGSQNLSGPGLANNEEVLLEIENDSVYHQFVNDWKRVHDQGKRARRRQDRREPSPLPSPTAENYPATVLEDGFTTGTAEYTVLSPFDRTEPDEVTIENAEFRASGDSQFFAVVQSDVVPSSSHIAISIEITDFIGEGDGEDSIFVGLFKDESNFLAAWYNHTRLDTGFDLHLDGARVEGGIQSDLALDDGSKFAFVLAEKTVSGFADIGDGWQHAFTKSFEAIDLTDPTVRDDYRYGVGALGEDGSIALERFGVKEARR